MKTSVFVGVVLLATILLRPVSLWAAATVGAMVGVVYAVCCLIVRRLERGE